MFYKNYCFDFFVELIRLKYYYLNKIWNNFLMYLKINFGKFLKNKLNIIFIKKFYLNYFFYQKLKEN